MGTAAPKQINNATSILDLSSFKKHLSEMLFFRYFPPKNSSIEQLFNDFLKKTSEKIAIPYKHFLKKDKSILN